MAAYPDLPFALDSQRIVRDGRVEDTLGDGAGRVRKLYADKADFDLKHPALTAAQVVTLDAFYAANERADFTLTWPEDGITYTVRFGKDAIRTRYVAAPDGGYRDVWVRLVAAA
jgi:hypothetical protein